MAVPLVLQALVLLIFISNECASLRVSSICSEGLQCDQWRLTSSWTQGGYAASCSIITSNVKVKSLVFKVYIVRHIYNCLGNSNNATKIVNSYFDQDGKACHLASGEDSCPGISKKVETNWLKLKVYCGAYTCELQYHRCELCSLVPWYSWLPIRSSRGKKGSRSCKQQLRQRGRRGKDKKCFRCDGPIMDSKYCDSNSKGYGKYFVDLSSSKPRWSDWKRSSECINNSHCENNVAVGSIVLKRYCHYPNHPVPLDPKYCDSKQSHTITRRCNVTNSLCLKSIPKKSTNSSKASNIWIAIILLSTIILVFSMLCIFVKYYQLKSGQNGCSGGIFSSCATQTSPKYSPRRIISEPEYALLGDWRQNVVHCPQPESNLRHDDRVYWGIEYQQLSDDELVLDEENSAMRIQDDTNANSPNGKKPETRECCELNADSKRALYAKIHSRR